MKINEIFKNNEEITVNSYLKKCGVENVKEFIKPHIPFEKPEIDNWFDYYNMDKARNMFIKHYNFKTPTYIICDSDLDGITSTAFIYMYMKALKEDWDIEILIHNGKERGLQDENIFQQIKSNPRGFIIIPDSGTNDRDKANELKGLDILVLDHHDIETPIENGILINNQSDKNKNISKNGSGCLVTYMFCKSLDNYFNNDWCHWNMDLVALSLISDSMNMADQQNRNFYHLGLETIDCVLNTFLESTFLRFIGNKSYTQRDISFKIVPKFNSVIRTENQELKRKVIECFTYECEDIGDILDLCEECHKNQITLVDNIINNNKDNIKNANKNNIVVLSCDDMPRSYSGLVAGKIMNLCGGKPTIVGKIKDNQLLGSLRSPIPLRSDLDSNELVEWAIGHENSCGVSINKDNIESLVEYYNNIKISYAVFAAGIFAVKPLKLMNYEFIKKNFDIAVFSVMLLTQVLASKKFNGNNLKGIVMISSVSALMGTKGYITYSAVKASMLGMVKSLAAELSPNVRVNAVLPGAIRTRTTNFLYESQETHNPRYLLGDGQANDVSNAISFLLSDRARWITGQEIVVDGGFVIS